MTKKVLVIAAHSDDEALGCSGTIAKHVAAGDEVHVLFMTDGVGARNNDLAKVEERKNSAFKAMKILNVSSMQNLDFADNRMDTIALLDVTQAIEKKINELQPEIIYTHHNGDLNIDHQITHKAVMTACRPQPDLCVKEIYNFEVLSSTEWQCPGIHPFHPNVYVDITDFIDTKKQVLIAYTDEMRAPPHSRSIENAFRLNAYRGNVIGKQYAEAFVLIRLIK